MPQQNEQKPFSSTDSQGIQRNKRQEEAFIASGNRQRARLNKNDMQKIELQQFMLSESISSVKRTLEEFEANATAELNQTTNSIEERIKKINSKVQKIKKDADKGILEARNKIIEPLAIFVGLFTFASIGFQTFAQVKEYILWMPMLLMVLGGFIIFASLVIHASSLSNETVKRSWYTYIVFSIGITLVICGGLYYSKAVEVLRLEDNKNCILVQSNGQDQNTQTERYCKYSR